jgi:hypothetical protein
MTLLDAQQTRVNFPAHGSTTLGAIAAKDPSYLGFLAAQTWLDFHLREAVALLCEHHGVPVKRAAAEERDPRQGRLF